MVTYYVYVMTNPSHTVFYTGITNDLKRRVYEHKHKLVPGFTSRYNANYLVYLESTPNASAAIAREKQIKGWVRAKKIAMVVAANPGWKDLSVEWYEESPMETASET